ncbi:MAG: Flp pilus assembly protein CpaB [Acidobacteria bacterium]|nr:MAG: Flp pilus assembly protein CpaB [Acidobacteriota bacterium]
MDVRRLALALLAALLVSAGAVFMFLKYSGYGKGQETKKIVAAARKMAPGSVLVREDLNTIDWPQNLPLTGTIADPDTLMKDQRVVLYPLEPGEPILEPYLALPGSGMGLVTKIPTGMRAVSVRSNEVVGVAGFLYPGSHVDVLATFRPEGSAQSVTQTILQNVEVITAGQKSQPDPTGKPETVNVVTLLLNPEDAEKVILATLQSSIQFVLRNGADTQTPIMRAVSTEELMGGNPSKKSTEVAQQQVGPVRRHPRIVKKEAETVKVPASYTVEIINGKDKSQAKF